MASSRRTLVNQAGFTLIELIIVIVVLAILSLIGSSMIFDTFKVAKTVNARQTAADQARYAVERLAREIRQIKYSSGSYIITSVTSPATSMTFTNTINGTDQAVTVDLNSGNLRLSYGTPLVLCKNVSSFSINYLQLDNSAASSTSNVRFVVLSLTVTDGAGATTITERHRVALRNG